MSKELRQDYDLFVGTGCAPFRSFIQDRAAENIGGEKL